MALLGVDHDDVRRELEIHGIEKFDASWDVLGEELGCILAAPHPQPGEAHHG